VTFDPAASDITKITIEWTYLATDEEIGGSPILSYDVESAEDDGQYLWAS
jgi:hypothetical protein